VTQYDVDIRSSLTTKNLHVLFSNVLGLFYLIVIAFRRFSADLNFRRPQHV